LNYYYYHHHHHYSHTRLQLWHF